MPRWLLSTACFLAAACTGPADPTDASTSTAETGVPTDTTDTMPTLPTSDTGSPLPDAVGLGGFLVDNDQEPIGGEQVLACTSGYCLTLDSGPDGFFWFDMEPGAAVALKTHEDDDVDPPRGAALEGHVVVGTGPTDAGRLCMPNLTEGDAFGATSADPQTLSAGNGLTLTLSVADLKPDFGQPLDQLSSGLTPLAEVPAYPELAGEELLADYALSPFYTRSESPIAVTVASTLPAGTLVHFWTVDALTGSVTGPIPGTADGSALSTDAGLGIDVLTHLLVSRP